MGKRDKHRSKTPEKVVPNAANGKVSGKVPILDTEASHSFLISFAYIEDQGPVHEWTARDGSSHYTVFDYLKQKQRDLTATTGDSNDHYHKDDRSVIDDAWEWMDSRSAIKMFKESLWSFRISGKERLWGLLVDEVFYVLWTDPDHKICKQKR
ncbi:MAG TPA: hypothetical protein VG944_15240 [Fimbriimonas sp.]|nr:hypothetical protein [Fimbriimonas sp.]